VTFVPLKGKFKYIPRTLALEIWYKDLYSFSLISIYLLTLVDSVFSRFVT